MGHTLDPPSLFIPGVSSAPARAAHPTCAWAPALSHGRGAVINHPIRSEPFPSAPSPPAHSPLLSLFLVESSSYKWYLCNLARMF